MKQVMKNNFGPLWPSDEQYHWNAFPKPTNIFSKKKIRPVEEFENRRFKKKSAFWFSMHFASFWNFFNWGPKHFRFREPTSGLKNQLAVQRSAFSNARKYPHLKKRLIIEFFVFDKIKILVSYLRWVIIVLSQKNSSKYHFAPLKFLNFIFKSKIMKTINSANGRNFPLN